MIDSFSKMFSGNPIAGYICIGIICYFLLGSLAEMLFGRKRGWIRQLAHLGFSIIAIIGAFFLTEAAINSIGKEFDENTMADLLAALEGYGLVLVEDAKNAITSIDPELATLILTLPMATIVAPLLFSTLFVVLNFVLKLIALIVNHFIPKAKSGASKLIGMAIGLAEGILVTSLVLLPVAAYTDLTSGVVAAADSAESADEASVSISTEIHSFIDEYLDPISSTPVLAVTKFLGGDAMTRAFATVELDGREIDMRDEIFGGVSIITSSQGFAQINWERLDEKDKEALTTLVDSISESEFFSEIFAGIFKTIHNLSEKDGAPIIADSEDGELVVALFEDILYILGKSTPDTVGEDLSTFKDLLFILSDGDVIAAFNGDVSAEIMIDVLNTSYDEEHTIVTKLISTIRKNERTKPLIATLTKLSITVMADDMGLGEDADRLYDSVTSGLSDINNIDPDSYSSDEEYTSAVSDSIRTTLEENGITLEQELIDDLAVFAADKHKTDGELSEDDIHDLLLEYYSIYAQNSTSE